MTSGMTLRGADALLRKLQQLSDASRGPMILRAVQAGALVIRSAHISKIKTTPSKSLRRAGEPIWLTGNLARSSHIEPGPKPGGVKKSRGTGLGAPTPTSTRAVVYIGTDVVYAPRLEFGFSGADASGRVYNQPPNPTLRPAFDENKDKALQKIAAVLRSQIPEEAKR